MSNQNVTINSRKLDGIIDKSWQVALLEETDEILTFIGVFEKEIRHSHLGIIRRGTISYEYYWKNKWFNVFRFHEPEGQLRNFYCNINMPPTFENNVLDYIDLDIDILVWSDFKLEILDLAEFEDNSVKFAYTKELITRAQTSLKDLIEMIKIREFPFNFI